MCHALPTLPMAATSSAAPRARSACGTPIQAKLSAHYLRSTATLCPWLSLLAAKMSSVGLMMVLCASGNLGQASAFLAYRFLFTATGGGRS
ncbi:hypothetical protein BV22DRAFT_888184 [Leucogyrophana mollusca]|uniref:Uncharacterized protein n=1 Tax=Leucogyrophana mollusca TaxID=85980 RepID=A0ACB8B120_9AGAM|nr:hypothetical protein BV22DRAFT_888184 [Leucogyrophana mollusca]